jgi:hypothetical protein
MAKLIGMFLQLIVWNGPEIGPRDTLDTRKKAYPTYTKQTTKVYQVNFVGLLI